jgi:hypothetical protein
MRNRSAVLCLGILLLALIGGCGGGVAIVKPADDQVVAITVLTDSPSGSPGHPVGLTATATNGGKSAIYCWQNCSDSPVQLLVSGPDGKQVLVLDPNRVVPACAGMYAPISPGVTLHNALTFDGTLYTRTGETYAAPAGIYTVIASLPYGGQIPTDDLARAESGKLFVWNRP